MQIVNLRLNLIWWKSDIVPLVFCFFGFFFIFIKCIFCLFLLAFIYICFQTMTNHILCMGQATLISYLFQFTHILLFFKYTPLLLVVHVVCGSYPQQQHYMPLVNPLNNIRVSLYIHGPWLYKLSFSLLMHCLNYV